MIHLLSATFTEAKPLIDIFKLKLKQNSSKLPIYVSERITLTVTGIGKINSAIGVAVTFYEFNKCYNHIWLNFGLAGHKLFRIGDIYLVNKISDISSNKVFYPHINEFEVKSHNCVTYDKQNNDYDNNLCEMESSGFFQSASKYSSKELIQIMKVISDNEIESINFFDKEKVYNLIINHKFLIINFCNFLLRIKDDFFLNHQFIDKQYTTLFKEVKFTFTETQQIKSLLLLYHSKNKSMNNNILDYKKDGTYNIKQLKKALNL